MSVRLVTSCGGASHWPPRSSFARPRELPRASVSYSKVSKEGRFAQNLGGFWPFGFDKLDLSTHNCVMTPFHIEKPVTLTIEQEDGETLRYVTPNLTFHMNNGRYNELTASHLTKLSYEPPKETTVTPEAPTTTESGPTPAQNQALKLIAGKARHIERQRFNNARRIQEVQEQAQADLNTVTHDFTLNVLGGVHDGLTYDQITEHLESLKLEGFEDAVQYAVDGDLDLAYPEVEG